MVSTPRPLAWNTWSDLDPRGTYSIDILYVPTSLATHQDGYCGCLAKPISLMTCGYLRTIDDHIYTNDPMRGLLNTWSPINTIVSLQVIIFGWLHYCYLALGWWLAVLSTFSGRRQVALYSTDTSLCLACARHQPTFCVPCPTPG